MSFGVARGSLAVKPREARVVVTRILRQAEWDWGLEPAVGSVVLAAQLTGLDGFGALDRDWEAIRSSDPEAISAFEDDGGWRLDLDGCHPFVAAPSVLDHLALAGTLRRTRVSVGAASKLELFNALFFFGPRYGMSIAAEASDGLVRLTAVPAPRGRAAGNISPLQAGDYLVGRACWERLLRRSHGYLIPESEVSRSHAGDGTVAFPLVVAPGQPSSGSK